MHSMLNATEVSETFTKSYKSMQPYDHSTHDYITYH